MGRTKTDPAVLADPRFVPFYPGSESGWIRYSDTDCWDWNRAGFWTQDADRSRVHIRRELWRRAGRPPHQGVLWPACDTQRCVNPAHLAELRHGARELRKVLFPLAPADRVEQALRIIVYELNQPTYRDDELRDIARAAAVQAESIAPFLRQRRSLRAGRTGLRTMDTFRPLHATQPPVRPNAAENKPEISREDSTPRCPERLSDLPASGAAA